MMNFRDEGESWQGESGVKVTRKLIRVKNDMSFRMETKAHM